MDIASTDARRPPFSREPSPHDRVDGCVNTFAKLDTLGDAVDCEARARGAVPPDPLPLEYGDAFGMTFRFRTQAGDAPVLRLLWRKEDGTWRITSYDVEVP